MLVGRDEELRQIGRALAQARLGQSATLALVGEPGIGKTTLLSYAADHADGMQVLRARGVESEGQIPFGSLFELIRPALREFERIPAPQAAALEAALAMRPGAAGDRFAVGAATLSLLAAYAEQSPVAVLIDDAQWLDVPSAQALLFAVRRLVADPIAVVIAALEGERSLLDGAGLPTLRLAGLTSEEAAILVPGLAPDAAARLHTATAGNPLALLELRSDEQDLALAPPGAPVLLSARLSRAFLQQTGMLDEPARQALVLAAASDKGDVPTLERAAARLGIRISALAQAETAGLVTLRAGVVEFRHPLARSAIYADAPVDQRRQAHRALAAALPDRDIDRHAWHLAAAAAGTDEAASAALERAGLGGRDRSAYATAAAAFERAARLTARTDRRVRLLQMAAEAAWLAGFTDRATALLDEARTDASDPAVLVDLDELAGHIAVRCGPVMRGHAILASAAQRAEPERAVAMLAEAAYACFLAANPVELLATADLASKRLPEHASSRARFLTETTVGMARIIGGDAAAGAESMSAAIAIAEDSAELREDLRLLPWVAAGPLFLRQSVGGRALLDDALRVARASAAVGALPTVLCTVARDRAGADQWTVAGAIYQEAIDLGRETGQECAVSISLAGLAWLHARRGQEAECRACAGEALGLSRELGTGLGEIWATAALGELELGLGHADAAAGHFERQIQLLAELGVTDADLIPAAELTEAYVRLGAYEKALAVAGDFIAAASEKGQPWPLARALRCQGLLAAEADFGSSFDEALALHDRTLDAFETARTQLAYGERLRRARNRLLAREQLRAAADIFDRLDARPWADRARAELAATGETRRVRGPSTIDELTPQELQIALLLTAGRTTRETAATLFLSPKTVEYHLRHVYQKLGIHSREELAQALAAVNPAQTDSIVVTAS